MEDFLKRVDVIFEDLFVKKAPKISDKAKDWIVKIIPWLSLIFGLLAIPGLLTFLGVSTVTAPFWLAREFSIRTLVSLLLNVAQVVLELVAVPYLFKAAKKGWQFLYYASLLSVVGAVLYFSATGVLFAAVGLYFLYQVKSRYK